MSYVASISYGKDSLKMLDVIKTRGLPLDRIITFDVWATDTIPTEFPEVTEFKKKMDIYIKNKYGIEVEHLCARYPDGSKITYENYFYRVFESGNNAGRIYGFPFQRGAWCNDRLKMGARSGAINTGDIEYIGIAYDEKKRHKIISETKVAPLVDFGIDEDLCGLHCKYEDILSPTYDDGYRDGCWFCHNQGVDQLRLLRRKHPELWSFLLKWDKDSPVYFKPDGHTVHDYDRRFELEDLGCLPIDRTFRWDMLYQDRQLTFLL
jgi:3'-phosphoadenosine 5'-phosphosulfate sulfotransferase (PAPS reductase)/FAD synthetase